MERYLTITKALSDASRVRLLGALREGELCVCQLIALLGLAPSTVSKHLSILQGAGLVASRKSGRWVYYRLPEAPPPLAKAFIHETFRALEGTETFEQDKNQLASIREMDLDALCKR